MVVWLPDEAQAANRILLDGVGLDLRVFYFFDVCSPEDRRAGLLRAYKTSQSIISRVQEVNKATRLLAYSPTAFYRLTAFSAVVTLKVIHSSYSNFVDIENGKRNFNSALSLIRQSSVEDNDLPGRSSKILSQLWSIHSQHYQKMKEPRIRLVTRSSASVLHDSLWLWRERFGGQGSGTNTPTGRFLDARLESSLVNKADNATKSGTSSQRRDTYGSQPIDGNNGMDRGIDMDWMWDLGMPGLVSWDAWDFERNPGDPSMS